MNINCTKCPPDFFVVMSLSLIMCHSRHSARPAISFIVSRDNSPPPLYLKMSMGRQIERAGVVFQARGANSAAPSLFSVRFQLGFIHSGPDLIQTKIFKNN